MPDSILQLGSTLPSPSGTVCARMICSFLFAALLFFICSVPLFYLQRSSFLFAAFLFLYLQRFPFLFAAFLFCCLQRFFFVCSVSFLYAAYLFCLQRCFLFAACPLWATNKHRNAVHTIHTFSKPDKLTSSIKRFFYYHYGSISNSLTAQHTNALL